MGSVDALLERAAAAGLPPSPNARTLLERYVERLLAHGRRLSLLSTGDLNEEKIASGHLADIVEGLLLAAPHEGTDLIDYGAGGGLVGFTWAALRPDLSITLLESKPRKARFLQDAAAELGLPNVRVWQGDARGWARRHPSSFDMAVARGVAADRKMLATLHRFLKVEGKALLFKGPESAGPTKERVRTHGGFAVEREKIALLGGGKRRVFLLLRREE